MSDSGWTRELAAERNARLAEDIKRSREDVIERGKRFLSEQERVRAAKGFVGALAGIAGLPVSPPADRATAGGASDPIKSRKPRETLAVLIEKRRADPAVPKWCAKHHQYGHSCSDCIAALSLPKPMHKPRAHPERDPGQPKWNKTEALYAQHLEIQKNFHRIVWWAFEGITLKLAPDTRYTPDFAVMTADHRLEFHEVKGAKKGKPRYEDDARVKIACAAEKFRPVRFIMVWPARNGEWDCKEF